MSSLQKFTILRSEFVTEYQATVTLYEHIKTKAQLLVIDNDDVNKVFGVTFRTPYPKSQGIAHILEHSVLCGSEKFPVKEPFVELIKSSLNTFINAFTYPDKTCYPVASTNTKDLHNMAQVYLDAVFAPKITPETFLQEGWHYEMDTPESDLIYKGVVFNEMKGVYSDPENVLGRYVQASVLPDTVYALDSGGDPTVIPTLTYQEFKDFHTKYYHPSNSMIYVYGDDHSDSTFDLIDQYLSRYSYLDVNASIAIQDSKTIHTEVRVPYDPGEKENPGNYFVVSWLLNTIPDYQVNNQLELTLLTNVLLGNPGSPLMKALYESGLGEDFTNTYLELDLQQAFLSVGMKGVSTENIPRLKDLIFTTLTSLVSEGISQKTVESSLNAIEFSLREQNTGRYPRGLSIMLSALQDWNYGGDPILAIQFEGELERIRTQVQNDPNYMVVLIDRYLLSNPHVNQTTLYPQAGLNEDITKLESTELSAIKATLSATEIDSIVSQTAELKRLQTTPDSDVDLASIPKLHIDDVTEAPTHKPFRSIELENGNMLFNSDIYTNGIVYLDLVFDISDIPDSALILLKLLWRCVLEMDTNNRSFVELNQDIEFYTGGIDFTTILEQSLTGAPIRKTCLQLKCLESRIEKALEIATDCLLNTNLNHQDKFKQILVDTISALEGAIVPSGHQYVMSYLKSRLSPHYASRETMSGISSLSQLRQLLVLVETNWSSVLEHLTQLRCALVSSPNKHIHITAPQDVTDTNTTLFSSFIQSISGDTVVFENTLDLKLADYGDQPAFVQPTQVNYVGKGLNVYTHGYALEGSIFPIVKYIGTEYLWEKVRVVGGAYGGFARFDQLSGVFQCVSFRDPNLLGTIDIYDSISATLSDLVMSPEMLESYIIGSIGDWDSYMLPDAEGWNMYLHHLEGISTEYLDTIRSQIISTTVDDFKAFGIALSSFTEQGTIACVTSQQSIDTAKGTQPFTVFQL
jgi:presequence protease